MTYVDCCPCHGADEAGARPVPEIRRYTVPPVQAKHEAAMARRMPTEDAQRVLLREEIDEDESFQAVTRLNNAYPVERWVAAESWRCNLADRASFMGAIFPSVRFQYRKDLWVLGQVLQRDKSGNRRGDFLAGSRDYRDGPDWLCGGRATVMGPRADLCAYWEAVQLMRKTTQPSVVELAKAHSYFDQNVAESDWRTAYEHSASELYAGCVDYLSRHGTSPGVAKQRAREFVAEAIDAWCYGGVDWPEGIEVSSLCRAYDNATRYLGTQDGPIDYDLPVVKSVLAAFK